MSIYEIVSERDKFIPEDRVDSTSTYGLVAVSLELQVLRHCVLENDFNTMKLLDALRIIEVYKYLSRF